MGSTSKSFAAAVILLLEAQGLLSIDDTVGKWLPQYPAWGDVSIRRLLDMTSGIPNYSETEFISHAWVEEPKRNLTAEELVKAAYPSSANHLPVTTGYHYSNTNYRIFRHGSTDFRLATDGSLIRQRCCTSRWNSP